MLKHAEATKEVKEVMGMKWMVWPAAVRKQDQPILGPCGESKEFRCDGSL
jgi:hypothetical protein